MSVDYKDLGHRIKKKRENLGMSQAELADQADLSTQHISNVENARSKIGLEKLVTVANVLNSYTDELLCGSVRTSRAVYSEEVAAIIETFSDTQLRVLPEFLRDFNYVYELLKRRMEEENNQ